MFRSLHVRLTLALLALLLLFGGFTVAFTLRTSRLYASEVQQRLHEGLALHVVEHQDLLQGGEIHKPALKELFHSLMVINPDIEVYLLDPAGRILAYSAPPGRVKLEQVSLEPVRRFLADGAGFPLRGPDPRHPGREKIFSAASIQEDGRLAGYLYIVLAGEQQASLAQVLGGSAILRSGLAALAVSLVLAVLAGLFLFRHLTGRLRRLSDRMAGLEETLPDTEEPAVPPTSGDELDRLDRSFHRMARRIRRQIRELEETDRLRRELVANVSHDLRTPLTHLEGYLETLLLKDASMSDEEKREYLQIALDQSRRLERLVGDLLELARLEARQMALVQEEFSASELVQDVVQKFRLPAREREVELTADLPESLATVSADLSLIERVLENLLDNALRHTPEGGRVRVAVEAASDRVRIEVRDTGSGIAEEEREKIFERFHRASTAESPGGLGLGLAIARRALELHDSALHCDSRPGAGTAFAFELRSPGAAPPPS